MHLMARTQPPQRLPTNEQGWGRVDLQQVVATAAPHDIHFWDVRKGLESGAAEVCQVQVSQSDIPLRLTLVYTDFPGEDLINRLFLFADPPTGQFFAGNDFARAGAPDATNNVQGIIVEEPEVGEWTIRVVAADVPEGPQDFALVVSGGGIGSSVESIV